MSREFYHRFFRVARRLARPFFPIERAPERSEIPEPAVLVCRHKDLAGPVHTMLWLKTPAHPWVFSVFCERKTCYRHFRDYTLTVRLKWPKWFALAVARGGSWFVPGLIGSMEGIPVYRNSAKVATTFRRSLKALKSGECLIVFPDVEYTSTAASVGAIYDGFLLLGEMFRRETGKALPFVPLAVTGRAIRAGKSLYMDPETPFEEEKARMRRRICRALDKLETEY